MSEEQTKQNVSLEETFEQISLFEDEHAKKMRNRLIEGIRKNIPYCRLNGPEDEGRLCNNVNFSFQYVEGLSLIHI